MSDKKLYFFDISVDYLDKTEDKDLERLDDIDAVVQSIYNILSTRKGTRPFYPEFGCDIEKYLFKINDYLTLKDLAEEIETAIINFEPRAKDVEVITTSDGDDDILIDIIIEVKNKPGKYKFSTSLQKIR